MKISKKPSPYTRGRNVRQLDWKKWLGQILFIYLPISAAIMYWGALASDRFVSESKFVIQNAASEKLAKFDVSSIISGGGGISNHDSYMVHEYILSWDMLSTLDQRLGLRKHFSSEKIDPISRLPLDASREDFLEYYRKRVRVDFDDASSITTVSAQAFDPAMAQRIVKLIIAESERFTNRVGHQAAREQVNFIAGELQRAQAKVEKEKKRIIEFQNRNKVLSPEIDTKSISSLVASLNAELALKTAKRNSLATYLKSSSPELKQLDAEIASIKHQIRTEKSKMTGSGNKTALNHLDADFQELQMGLEFGSNLYRSTLASLETARIDASRKLKHLVLLEQAFLPETAEYPRRAYNIITFTILTLMVYWIGKLAVATIRDHKD